VRLLGRRDGFGVLLPELAREFGDAHRHDRSMTSRHRSTRWGMQSDLASDVPGVAARQHGRPFAPLLLQSLIL
jgi:hypothetical protein